MHNITIANHGSVSREMSATIFIEVHYFCNDCDCQHFFYITKYKGYPVEPGSCGAIINGRYTVAQLEDWQYYKILADLMKDDILRTIDALAAYYNVN